MSKMSVPAAMALHESKEIHVDNKRYRYLMPEGEPALMTALDGPRAHLKPMVR